MKAIQAALALFMVTWLAAPAAFAQPAATGAPAEAKIPHKWLKKYKGYEKALDIQKSNGADIVLYFSRSIPADQKGLCRWWEKKGMKSSDVQKALKAYIKVQIDLPSNRDSEALAKKLRVKHCPALVVIHPDGRNRYFKVFDWPGGKPKLKKPEEIVDALRKASSESYQEKKEE